MLDYTKQKKKYLTVKLIDETTLFIGAPKKTLYAKLTNLEEKLKDIKEVEPLYDEVTDLAAEILSNNNQQKKYTPAAVDEFMDIEDMSLLILEYAKFAGGIVASPN